MTLSLRTAVVSAVLVLLALVPLLAALLDEPFYTVLFGRMLILSIGAVSLNLIRRPS